MRVVQQPVAHLRDIERAGGIGVMAPDVVSFMGYQPDATRVVEEMVPAIMEHTKQQERDAALLAKAAPAPIVRVDETVAVSDRWCGETSYGP